MDNMKTMKKPVLLALVGFFILCAPGHRAHGSWAQRMSLEELVEGSDRVVVGTVADEGRSAWGPDNLRIFTQYTVEVDSDVAGEGKKTLQILQPGGTVGKLSQKVHGYPTFRSGQYLMLFLQKQDQSFRVVGLSQGVFALRREGARKILSQKLEGLSFPNDPAAFPLQLEWNQAISKIRALWSSRRRSPVE